MQVANIMLALGGDPGQVIPKFGVTPSEVAVLRVIHGNDAVSDIEVVGTVNRPHRVERDRLVQDYGRGINGEIRAPAVDALFPGAAARLFETFDEIEGTGEDDVEHDEVFTPAPVVAKPKKGGRPKKATAPATDPQDTPETDHFE